MLLRLCIIVESFYLLQVRDIIPHNSSRDLPCHKTKKIWFLHQISLKLWSAVFLWLQQKSWIRTYLCTISLLIWHSLWVQPKYTWSRNDVGSPSQSLPWEFSKSVPCFLFCLPVWYRPHTRVRKVLLLGWQKNIPSLKLFPNHVPIELSQIAFHIRVLPKVIHTDSFREERLGLPYWTMILAICVVVDESKCLDTPIWEFSIICEHLPFWAEYKRILHLLLVHRNPAIWRWYPWSWRLSFEMLKILVQWILRKTLNHLLQCHLGVRLYAFVFLTLKFQLRNLKMTEIHPWRKTIFSALRLWFIDHFFLVSDYRQLPCRIFLLFFPILSPLPPFASGIFNAWGIGMNLCTRL